MRIYLYYDCMDRGLLYPAVCKEKVIETKATQRMYKYGEMS